MYTTRAGVGVKLNYLDRAWEEQKNTGKFYVPFLCAFAVIGDARTDTYKYTGSWRRLSLPRVVTESKI